MCIIVFKKIDSKNYIAKNRDKSIKTNISIIHELLDNVEIVYMFDIDTYWLEGMNQFGIGAVNSTLAVKTDEIIDRSEYQKKLFNTKRNILKNNNLEKMSNEWISFSKFNDLSRHGHTLICNNLHCKHIESFHGEIPIKETILNDAVFTNHSIHLKNKGYSYGKKYLSSLVRKELAYNEIVNINDKSEILKCLNKNYINLNPELHTYRNKNCTISYLKMDDNFSAFNTVSQVLMCLSELIFYFNYDIDNCNFVKYSNRLPKNYAAKIKVVINQISKSKKPEAIPFKQDYINILIENNMYKKKNILYYCIFLIMIMYIYIFIMDK
jgi:hypothetical protein